MAQLSSQNEYIMRKLHGSKREAGMTVAGICGAPVVHQEDEDGNVSNVCLEFFCKFDACPQSTFSLLRDGNCVERARRHKRIRVYECIVLSDLE